MSVRIECAGRVRLLDQPLISVGRSSTNDFQVTGGHVSRHHLEIAREQDGYVLRDVSTLGLFDVHGAKLPPAVSLGSEPVQIRLGSEHGLVLTLRRGPRRHAGDEAGRPGSTRRGQLPKSAGEWTAVVRAGLKPYWRTALFALGGACFAYLANFYIAAKVYDGYVIPPGGAATGGPSENSARLLWFLASALLMSVVGLMIRLRPAGFMARVRALPGTWWSVTRTAPTLCLATLMLTAAVALLLSGVLIPSLSLVLGLGMLALVPTPLGSLLISVLGGLFARILGGTRQVVSVTTDGLGVAVLVGGALALMLRWRADGTGARWVLVGVLACVGLVLMARERRQISDVTVMMFGFAGVVVVRLLTDGARVLADDGGWAECGARLGDFLRCDGVPELAKGMGDGAAAGAAGGAVGGVVSSPGGVDDSTRGDDDGRFEHYDEDGYLETVVYDDDGDKIPDAVEHYDRDGNVIRTDFFDGEGKSDGYEVPTYGTDNRQNGTVRRDKDGNITVVRELDDHGGYTDTQYDPSTGKPASSHQEHGDGRHTVRENPDSDGNFTKATEYDRDHRKVETTEMTDDGGIRHTKYDPETGDPTTSIQEHPDGTKTVLSDPDPDGVATKKLILDGDDNVTRKSVKNDDGSSTHTDYDPSTGKAWRETTEEPDGSTTVLSDPDEDGVARHKATYDSNGNLTRESVKNRDGSSTHTDYDPTTGDVVKTTTTPPEDLPGAEHLDAPPPTRSEGTADEDLPGAEHLDAPPPPRDDDVGEGGAQDRSAYDPFDEDGDGVLDGGFDEDGNLRATGHDTDGDDRIDKIIYYDDEGNPTGYEYDRNADGHLDTYADANGEETFIGQEHERADGATALRDADGNIYGWEKDTDGDGSADYWEFRDEGGVYAESDRNRDGSPDTRYEYDSDGRLVRSSRDTDYDGKYDSDRSYDRDGNVTGRYEDTNDDGIPNQHYDGDGNLRASGADTDGDGQDDELVYYDDEGNPYAHEYDSDGDGRLDAYADRPPEAGWYDDPKSPSQLRWWDGSKWTTHTRSDEGT